MEPQSSTLRVSSQKQPQQGARPYFISTATAQGTLPAGMKACQWPGPHCQEGRRRTNSCRNSLFMVGYQLSARQFKELLLHLLPPRSTDPL